MRNYLVYSVIVLSFCVLLLGILEAINFSDNRQQDELIFGTVNNVDGLITNVNFLTDFMSKECIK